MLGRDYYSWGSKRHISHRYGDNQGNPYVGPIKFHFLDKKRILVHAKNQILHVQSLEHAIEAQIHPTIRGKPPTVPHLPGCKCPSIHQYTCAARNSKKPSENVATEEGNIGKISENQSSSSYEEEGKAEEKLSDSENDVERQEKEEKEDKDEEDWEAKILMMETNEIGQSKVPIRHAVVETMTLASASAYNENMIVMVDDHSRIKLFDLQRMEIMKSFGEIGDHPGGILRPTSIACVSVGVHTKLILVGDSCEGQKQRISCFSSHGEFITEFGSEGPMLGQFRDISCIAIRPSQCDKGKKIYQQLQRQRTVAILRGTKPESIRLPQAPMPIAVPSPIFPEDDYFNYPYIPSWYQPSSTADELEDMLYNDDMPNNFVVGQREYDTSIFDILFVSPEKKIVRLQAKYQSQQDIEQIIHEGNTVLTEEEKRPGFFISNRMGEKIIYSSLHELLRKNPYVKELRIREESRDSVFFAVVDRRNYRIQLMRLFWTRSLLFSPMMEVVDIIGGPKAMHCELVDPVAIAYAPTGDLAICDAGRNGILILSPTYHLVKFLQLSFESVRDLKEAGAIAQRERERKKAEEESVKKRRQQAVLQKSRRVHEERILMEKQGVKEKFSSEAVAVLTTFSSSTGAASPFSTSSLVSQGSNHSEPSIRGRRGTNSSNSDAVEKESAAKKKPSWIAFGEDGSMVVGFHSGGLYVFKPNMSQPVGKLEKLEFTILAKVIVDYLTYLDIIQLRNTCRYLHDFTRELRLCYRIFPPDRRLTINKVLYLFTRWARINPDGSDNLKDRVFTDVLHRPICPYHMRLQCNLLAGTCTESHEDVVYDRADLQQTGAYLIFDDFLFVIGDLFGPTFIYQFESLLQALFHAYSKPQSIFQMHDSMSRANETIRERIPVSEVNVLYYRDVLELILVLEEQYCGFKDLVDHKLFASSFGKGRRRNQLPDIATNFDSLANKTAYTDVLAQYDHGIGICPVKHNLGRRMITRPGFEDKVIPLHAPISTKEHVQLVQRHTERAVALMDRLFS